MFLRFFTFFILFSYSLTFADDFYYNGDKKIILTKINQDSNLQDFSNVTYYKTITNSIVGVSDEIILKLKDPNMLEYLSQKYNFLVIDTIMQNTYLIKVANKDLTLQIANQLYLENSIQYASPNFIKSMKKR